MCSNSGNYGLPVALLAFGREALAFASVYFVSSAIFSYTGGVLLAASGRRSVRDALAGLLRVPAFYGAVAALITMGLGLSTSRRRDAPDGAAERRGAAADDPGARHAARARDDARAARWWSRRRSLSRSSLTPLAAFGWRTLVGLQGAALQAGVLQSSMPTAVITTILALEFDALPQLRDQRRVRRDAAQPVDADAADRLSARA